MAAKDVFTKVYWSYRDSLEVKNDVLYKRWEVLNLKKKILQLIVKLKPRKLVVHILRDLHNSPTGHFGINKTLDKVRRRFYWAICKQDVEAVEEWCKTWKIC